MRQEVDDVLGERTEITWNDINQLEYIHLVFKETLRIMPVAPASCRIIQEETVIDGIRLPANSPIMVSPVTLNYIQQRKSKNINKN